MTRATPYMRVLSQSVIAHETEENPPSEINAPTAFFVFEKLRPHLANLMGRVGVRALVQRALALANAEVSTLRAVKVNADGGLERFDGLEAQFGREATTEGSLILLAQLLGLLVAFIGEHLTVRMVREVWPKLSPPTNLDFPKGGKNEKTK